MKLFKYFAAMLLLVLPLLIVARPAVANNTPYQKIINVGSDEVIEGTYFASGDSVEIFGTIQGDLYVAGGQVFVAGTVEGDVIAAGGTVDISGNVLQDVRAAGGQVNVSGEVNGNMTLLGGDINIAESAQVNGGLVSAGGNLTVNAPLNKLDVAVGNLMLNSAVNSDISARVGTMRVTEQASVNGNVMYWSEEEVSISEEASISGEIQRKENQFTSGMQNLPTEEDFNDFARAVAAFTKLSALLTTLVIGLIVIKLFPIHTVEVVDNLRHSFLKSLGVGLLTLIVFPIVLIILFVTLLGIPLALTTLFLFIFYSYLSRIYVMVIFGSYIADLVKRSYGLSLTFVIGMLVYYLLSMIPIIGDLIKLVFLIAGLGAAVYYDKNMLFSKKK